MSGFVIIQRTAATHYLLNDAAKLGAWTWLLMRAAWKPIPFVNSGKTITLERGQLCVSVRQLAEEWGWSKSAVARFLARLETETMIEREAGQGRNVITICNYCKYQDVAKGEWDKVGTASGTKLGQQRDTKEPLNQETIKPITPLSPPKGVCKPDGLPDDVWRDWKRVRKRPVTRTVLTRIENEAAKIGWTLSQAITEAAESGWQGFKADWVTKDQGNGSGSRDNRDGVAKALDRRLGLDGTANPFDRCNDARIGSDSGSPPARIADMRS